MTEQKASETAMGVAVLRAAHQLIDGEPKILGAGMDMFAYRQPAWTDDLLSSRWITRPARVQSA